MGKGEKSEDKGSKKSGKGSSKGPTLKPCSKGGIFMGGTIGITSKPDRNNYYNVVINRNGTPAQFQSCRTSGPPAGTVPIIICPPNTYPPPSCPQQPRRRCC